MAKKLEHVLVIDIECTCWDGPPPAGQVQDIIEVGLVPLVVATGERLEKRSLLVRPMRSTVSRFCTELTTLTQEQVAAGLTFKEVCRILRDEYRSEERLLASWGDYDRRQFERQCRDQGVPYPFGPTHLNVKNLFGIAKGLNAEVGVPQALGMLGRPFEGQHHRGHDDAWNIASVLGELLQRLR